MVQRIGGQAPSSLEEIPLPPPYKHIDKELVTRFFLVFSRFEYALKRSEFVWSNGEGHAQPRWRDFAKDLESCYNLHESPQLAEAVEYLFSRPPQRQVVKQDGSLGWGYLKRRENQTDIDWLLDIVRMVRNNLFHGGKHMEEPAHDNRLLKSSLIVLAACLRWNPKVKRVYETYGL